MRRRAAVAPTLAGALLALTGCGGGRTDATTAATTTVAAAGAEPPSTAELVVRAWRFTSSPEAEALLRRQEAWTAECMGRAGFAYEAVVPPPARPGPDDPDYGLVDHFLSAGQDRRNAAVVDALDPTAALAWRTALDGPPRSMDEERPATDDPARGGCAPVALAALVGTQNASAAGAVVGLATELAAEARSDPAATAARDERVTCLRAAVSGLGPEELASGVEPFPVVRDWVAAAFPDLVDDPTAVRRLAETDPAAAATVAALRDRERALRAADRGCGDRRAEDAAIDAALRDLAVESEWDVEQRRAADVALDALEHDAG